MKKNLARLYNSVQQSTNEACSGDVAQGSSKICTEGPSKEPLDQEYKVMVQFNINLILIHTMFKIL